MAVGYDITVVRNNHTRTEAHTRLSLNLTLLTSTIAKEEIKDIRHLLNGLRTATLCGLDMNYCMNGNISSLGKIYWLYVGYSRSSLY